MKIKEDLMLRNIAGSWIVVPMGERLLEFNGMLEVNDTGAFIWKLLEQDKSKEEIIAALLDTYEITEASATDELDVFLKTLEDAKVLEA